MKELFPDLCDTTEATSRTNDTSHIKFALHSLVSEERLVDFSGVEEEIRRNSPEECIASINLLSRAIGNAHKHILYYSTLQGELLSVLNDVKIARLLFDEIPQTDVRLPKIETT